MDIGTLEPYSSDQAYRVDIDYSITPFFGQSGNILDLTAQYGSMRGADIGSLMNLAMRYFGTDESELRTWGKALWENIKKDYPSTNNSGNSSGNTGSGKDSISNFTHDFASLLREKRGSITPSDIDTLISKYPEFSNYTEVLGKFREKLHASDNAQYYRKLLLDSFAKTLGAKIFLTTMQGPRGAEFLLIGKKGDTFTLITESGKMLTTKNVRQGLISLGIDEKSYTANFSIVDSGGNIVGEVRTALSDTISHHLYGQSENERIQGVIRYALGMQKSIPTGVTISYGYKDYQITHTNQGRNFSISIGNIDTGNEVLKSYRGEKGIRWENSLGSFDGKLSFGGIGEMHGIRGNMTYSGYIGNYANISVYPLGKIDTGLQYTGGKVDSLSVSYSATLIGRYRDVVFGIEGIGSLRSNLYEKNIAFQKKYGLLLGSSGWYGKIGAQDGEVGYEELFSTPYGQGSLKFTGGWSNQLQHDIHGQIIYTLRFR